MAPEGRKVGSPLWRETISKSKCTKHTMFGPRLEVAMSKSACLSGAKHISKSKCAKHTMVGALLEVEMSKKCTPRTQNVKNTRGRTTFGHSDVVSHGRGKGLCTLSKVSKTGGFCRRKFRSQTSDNMDR